MAGMTNAHEAECLNHMVAGSEFTYSTSLFLCLFTADPTEAGTLTSETDYGGAREAISYKAAVSGRANNNAIASLDTTGWDGVDITHWGLSKTSVRGAGQLNWFGPTSGTVTYTPGDILTIAEDTLYCTFYDGPQPGTAANLILTDVGANQWLNHSLGVTQWTGLTTSQVSLHTAAPAAVGNEFAGGGYARQGFTAGAPSAGAGDYQNISHTNPIGFTNIQSTPLVSWGLWQGTDLIYIRNQGSAPVTPGSSIDAAPGTLIVAVD